MPMSPGTYLRKRREAAGLDLRSAAFRFATLPEARRQATISDVVELARRLAEAEADRDTVSVAQARLLRQVFALDLAVYEQLLLAHHADPDAGLPQPHVCRGCACSWHDACVTEAGPCAWSDADPGLCTACVQAIARVVADWPDAPLPEGVS